MIEYRIDAGSLQRALRRLSPERFARQARAAMEESLAFLQTEVQRRTPVFQGHLRGGIFTEIRGQSIDIRGIVAPSPATRDYASVVELGRRPGGKLPPRGPIERWTKLVLGDASLWFVVARAIARRGTKPRRMFAQAAAIGQRVVPEIFRKHIRA